MKKDRLDIALLTAKIQSRDKDYAIFTSILKVVYVIIIISFLVSTLLLDFDEETKPIIIQNGIFLLALISISVYLFKYNRKMRKADYSLPTLLMLKDFVKRYRIFPPIVWWVIIGAVLMLIAAYMESISRFYTMSIAFIIGFIVGYVIYFVKDKPLVDAAKILIKELEEI